MIDDFDAYLMVAVEGPDFWAAWTAVVERHAMEEAAALEAAHAHEPGSGTYYDRKRREIGLWRWAALYEDMGYRTVAHTVIGRRRVVTLWMGTPDSLTMIFGGMPRVFETAYFGSRGDCEILERHATECHAMAWHMIRVWIERWRLEFALTTGKESK